MKYLFELANKYHELELSWGETKQIEYIPGYFAKVTLKRISKEPTPTCTGSATLHVQDCIGHEVVIDATIARTMTEQDHARIILGTRIARIRQQLGMTQAELSKKSGVNVSNLCRIEAGKYSAGLDVLARIAEALGYRLDLVTDTDQ